MKRFLRFTAMGALCLFAVSAFAQIPGVRLPEAPKPTFMEHLLYAGDATARGFDVYTTHEMLKNPYDHESIMPDAIAHHTAALAATDGALSFGIYRVSRLLDEHGHHRLAILVPVLDIAGVGYMDIHNNSISGEKPPVHYDKPPGYIPPASVIGRR